MTGRSPRGAANLPQEGMAVARVAGGYSPAVAVALARLLQVVADEALRNQDFSQAVAGALVSAKAGSTGEPGRARRRNRRPSGPLDPFAVLAEVGEDGPRQHLLALDL